MKAIIYHKTDLDGIFSGAIAFRALSTHRLLDIPLDYNDDLPDLMGCDEIFVLDIDLREDQWDQLLGNYNIVHIDHHPGSREKYPDRTLRGRYKFKGDSEKNRKAALELTWEFFNPPQSIPETLRELSNWDIFRNRKENSWPKTRAIQLLTRFFIRDLNDAIAFLDNPYLTTPQLNLAMTMDKMKQRELDRVLEGSVVVDGVLCINSSDTFLSAYLDRPLMFYHFNGKEWKLSFRGKGSRQRALDLQGGGHEEAASARVSTDVLKDILEECIFPLIPDLDFMALEELEKAWSQKALTITVTHSEEELRSAIEHLSQSNQGYL